MTIYLSAPPRSYTFRRISTAERASTFRRNRSSGCRVPKS
nr:MAG TPA: hypothetical protein [Caudoviricetes sp.]